MINLQNIPSNEIDKLINKLDEKVAYINSKLGIDIDLKSYGNILRVALNAIQKGVIENLIERLTINRELENTLDSAGGYSIDFFKNDNPKEQLLLILDYLKENLPKQKAVIEFLKIQNSKRIIAVFDNNDLEFAQQQIKNRKIEIVSFFDLKKLPKEYTQNKGLVFHFFNGNKDFDYFYNLNSEVQLIVYEEEKNLYYKFLNQRKKLIEAEIKSDVRFIISKVEYKEIKENIININYTINSIATRLDKMTDKAYESYKNECDLLLVDSEEKLIYKVIFDTKTLFLESNDTIFTEKGDLNKIYKIKVGDKIRIYPKEHLAENLYQVAVETEPDIFGKVDEHANFWKQLINELRVKLGEEKLYQNLKEKGLKVLPTTLANYGKGFRKFPMFKNDLKAIFKLYYQDKSDSKNDTILESILKSKTVYNSTMIVLGRGLKQELRLFLKENKVGDILKKLHFNENTLRIFIEKFMPIHTVNSKEVFSENINTLEEEKLQLFEI
ncbi:MAG: hypothetical protein MUC49_20930 [Raineya sp.]|jgi:hypothetical protein|nr:hypothetical protein [Raineya sp.]